MIKYLFISTSVISILAFPLLALFKIGYMYLGSHGNIYLMPETVYYITEATMYIITSVSSILLIRKVDRNIKTKHYLVHILLLLAVIILLIISANDSLLSAYDISNIFWFYGFMVMVVIVKVISILMIFTKKKQLEYE